MASKNFSTRYSSMARNKKTAWVRRLGNLIRPGHANDIARHFAAVISLADRTVPAIQPAQLRHGLLVSFIAIVRDVSKAHLRDLMNSIAVQPAQSAELMLCVDPSASNETLSWLNSHGNSPFIRVIRDPDRPSPASMANSAIELARGQWIAFIDPEDAITPCLVSLIAHTTAEHPRCQFIYTDEVVCDENLRPVEYLLKPAFDEVMLSGGNYIGQLACYRRERVRKMGGLRDGHAQAECFDLLLRYLRNLPRDEIKHLPFPGYRRRTSQAPPRPLAPGQDSDGARLALAEHFRRGASKADVDDAMSADRYRVRFDKFSRPWPRVSVIIPNRNSFRLMERLLTGLVERTDYPDLEIIVSDNGTTDHRVLDLYDGMRNGGVPFDLILEPGRFNFSRQVNRGVERASGEFALLLNNDIEVIDPEWLREMVSCFDYSGTGIVGARLLYPDRRLQHAGVIVGLRNGLAAHWFVGRSENYSGPMARLHVRQTFSAVTGACMLISRQCLDEVGGFDEIDFRVAYNDIDFCMRAAAKGFRIVWTPFATLIHHESASRGRDNRNPAKLARLRHEQRSLRRHTDAQGFDDPAFSPWYSRKRLEPTITLLDRIPRAR